MPISVSEYRLNTHQIISIARYIINANFTHYFCFCTECKNRLWPVAAGFNLVEAFTKEDEHIKLAPRCKLDNSYLAPNFIDDRGIFAEGVKVSVLGEKNVSLIKAFQGDVPYSKLNYTYYAEIYLNAAAIAVSLKLKCVKLYDIDLIKSTQNFLKSNIEAGIAPIIDENIACTNFESVRLFIELSSRAERNNIYRICPRVLFFEN